MIEENAKWIRDQREENSFPLNFDAYKNEIEKTEEQAKRFEQLGEYKTNLTYESLPYEQELFPTDTILAEKRKRWHENLSSDVYLEEALHVLEDLKTNNIKKSKVAHIRD